MPNAEEDLVPRDDAEACRDTSSSATASVAARALILGLRASRPVALRRIEDELSAVGFHGGVPLGPGALAAPATVEESDAVLAEHEVLGVVRESEQVWGGNVTDGPVGIRFGQVRVDLWNELVTRRSRPHVLAWLRVLMADGEPFARVAAAAALYPRLRRRREVDASPVRAAVGLVEQFTASRNGLVRNIAEAAAQSTGDTRREQRRNYGDNPSEYSVSVIVHGTFSYGQQWWFNGGDFHDYVRAAVRPNLYSGLNPFAWSGALSARHRRTAGERFAGWVRETSRGRMETVFAHSYGGSVALEATLHGVQIDELVLLSAPAEHLRVEWRNIGRAMSLRIHLDLVVLAAGWGSRFTENVEEYVLPRWFSSHSDTHNPEVWRRERCAELLNL